MISGCGNQLETQMTLTAIATPPKESPVIVLGKLIPITTGEPIEYMFSVGDLG
jgi:hypothetical protein